MFYMYIITLYLQAVTQLIKTQIVLKQWDVKDEEKLSQGHWVTNKFQKLLWEWKR